MTSTHDNEQYDEALTKAARPRHAAMLSALKAGAPQTTLLICDAVGQHLADQHALADVLRRTAAGENALQQLLNDMVWHEAEQLAVQDVVQQERDKHASVIEARAERAAWERQFA